jgi:hypothetical protein
MNDPDEARLTKLAKQILATPHKNRSSSVFSVLLRLTFFMTNGRGLLELSIASSLT